MQILNLLLTSLRIRRPMLKEPKGKRIQRRAAHAQSCNLRKSPSQSTYCHNRRYNKQNASRFTGVSLIRTKKSKRSFRKRVQVKEPNSSNRNLVNKQLIGSLSKDVFERRTSPGRRRFAFLGSGFAQICGQIVSTRVRTLSNTNW